MGKQKIIALVIVLILIILIAWLWAKHGPLYFDNNGTTPYAAEALAAYRAASNLGNASTPGAGEARRTIAEADALLRDWTVSPSYQVVWTSGGSESNNLVIRGAVDGWWARQQSRPHVVASSLEHKTSLLCLEELMRQGRADYSLLAPNGEGLFDPVELAKIIRPTTCLVTIMHANNELGSLADLPALATVCRARSVPLHTDAVQTFGKYPPPLETGGIAACSVSFHKLYGPPGVGALLLSPELAKLLVAQISGTQQGGLRGGTENIPGIAAAAAALRYSAARRCAKNAALARCKEVLIARLRDAFPIDSFAEYRGQPDTYSPPSGSDKVHHIVFLGPTTGDGLPDPAWTMPNTLCFSIVKHGPLEAHFCNLRLRDALLKEKITVSVGSACNTSDAKPSHVMMALKAPYCIRCGVIRVSFGDQNSPRQVERLADRLIALAKAQ